jgi:hypothetical protein
MCQSPACLVCVVEYQRSELSIQPWNQKLRALSVYGPVACLAWMFSFDTSALETRMSHQHQHLANIQIDITWRTECGTGINHPNCIADTTWTVNRSISHTDLSWVYQPSLSLVSQERSKRQSTSRVVNVHGSSLLGPFWLGSVAKLVLPDEKHGLLCSMARDDKSRRDLAISQKKTP